MATQNSFQDQLNDALEKVQATYSQKVQAARTKLSDANTKLAGSSADHKEAQQQLKDSRKLAEEVKNINNRAVLAGLIAKNALAVATASGTASGQVSSGVSAAAKAINTMVQSVTIFISSIASVYAKLASEDEGSEPASKAAALFEQSKEVALQAERASLLALDAAIRAAQSRAPKVLETVTTASADIDALAAALGTTLTGLQTQVSDMEKALSGSVTTEETSELGVTQANIGLKSAQMIGGNNGESADAVTKESVKEPKK
jgi:hypothetical protein